MFMKKKLILMTLTILTIMTLVGCSENTEKLTVEKESFNRKNFSIELYYPKDSNIEIKGGCHQQKRNSEHRSKLFYIYLSR